MSKRDYLIIFILVGSFITFGVILTDLSSARLHFPEKDTRKTDLTHREKGSSPKGKAFNLLITSLLQHHKLHLWVCKFVESVIMVNEICFFLFIKCKIQSCMGPQQKFASLVLVYALDSFMGR